MGWSGGCDRTSDIEVDLTLAKALTLDEGHSHYELCHGGVDSPRIQAKPACAAGASWPGGAAMAGICRVTRHCDETGPWPGGIRSPLPSRRRLPLTPQPSALQCRMVPPLDPARAFRLTLDLCDAGVRLMRQNLRRRHAEAEDAAIDRLLVAWLRERPGAEHGDSPGRHVDIAARLG